MRRAPRSFAGLDEPEKKENEKEKNRFLHPYSRIPKDLFFCSSRALNLLINKNQNENVEERVIETRAFRIQWDQCKADALPLSHTPETSASLKVVVIYLYNLLTSIEASLLIFWCPYSRKCISS